MMDKKLYTRLFKIALPSSPIIALYGVTPVYIFNKIPFHFILFAGSGIMITVLIFWIVNIWIVKKSDGQLNNWKWYLLSYTLIMAIHFGFFLLRDIVAPPRDIENQVGINIRAIIAYPLVSVVAINTIILIICNSVLLGWKKENAELEIEQLKVNSLEAQKKVLMQQLQPHFLFNALSVLKSLIKENPDEAENYSVKLSDFLRYTIQVSNSSVVSVEEELKFTADYIELQKVRFDNSFHCEVNIPSDVYQYKLPAYALQTLVENAVKHNSFTEKKPLRIVIDCQNGHITVTNNKLLARAADSPGTGLANLNERYKLIANKTINIKSEAQEFSVSVPLLN